MLDGINYDWVGVAVLDLFWLHDVNCRSRQ